ncbi:hypothetical protein LTR50_002258 [Elasticomyces elasticus]|nr:hypothetical protein LTR50_002258 [Elasticomyces elasticus]
MRTRSSADRMDVDSAGNGPRSSVSRPSQSSKPLEAAVEEFPPSISEAESAAFKQAVIEQLTEVVGEKRPENYENGLFPTRTLDYAYHMLKLLERATFFDSKDAVVVSMSDMRRQLASLVKKKLPIFTQGERSFHWEDEEKRPIEQIVGRWLQDKQKVQINDSKRGPTEDSAVFKLGYTVKKRFLEGGLWPDHPWNSLDIAMPLLGTRTPSFLQARDAELLRFIRGRVMSGRGVGREFGTVESEDAAKPLQGARYWNDIEHWMLLAEGGAQTLPHMDAHGLATYLTIEEGDYGFGWLANPTKKERAAWLRDRTLVDGDKWRYTVLKAGQTVFFPAGTIHFVFRKKGPGGQSLVFGGHALLWSQLQHMLDVIEEQIQYPDVTNEDVSTEIEGIKNVQYIQVLNQALKEGDPGVVELAGGEEEVESLRQRYEVYLAL